MTREDKKLFIATMFVAATISSDFFPNTTKATNKTKKTIVIEALEWAEILLETSNTDASKN